MKIIWERTVNKLTTEQLLFAHRIGATQVSGLGLLKKIEGDNWFLHDDCWIPSSGSNEENRKLCKPIDFSPLYDWIDHDGGECPVLPGDVVEIRINGRQTSILLSAKTVPNWGDVTQFKLARESDQPAHYAEDQETEHYTAHHKRPDGADLIDDWWNDYQPEIARILMWEQVRKYQNRLGKKDPVHIEVSKMADYLRRWAEKEQELASNPED